MRFGENLEREAAVPDMFDKVSLRHLISGEQNDEGADAFAQPLMRHGNHR